MSGKETLRGPSKSLMTEITKNRLISELRQREEDLSNSGKQVGEAAGDNHDWHDNFAFEQATREVQLNMARVFSIKESLMNVEIIEPREVVEDVGIGNNILIQFDGDEEVEEFSLLGPDDVATKDTWISFKSPLGANALGKKAGEELEYAVGERTLKAKIVDILPGKFEIDEK